MSNLTGQYMTWREIITNFVRDALRTKTELEILQKELHEARLSKLEAETALEYATSVVSYNDARIARLKDRITILGDTK
jgi:hypothetical protein